jgi:hypothetical protein
LGPRRDAPASEKVERAMGNRTQIPVMPKNWVFRLGLE